MLKLSCVIVVAITLQAAVPDDVPAVFSAIRADRPELLLDLRAKGVNINAPGERSTPPLTYAAAFGSIAAMRVLLDAGADVNAKTAFGATALHWAAQDTEKIRLLLGKGADVNIATNSKRTPIILAGFNNPSVEAMTLLLGKGADLKAKDSTGVNALLAATSGDHSAVAQFLVDKGSDVNSHDGFGTTPLMNAAAFGDVELIRFLLAHGAKVNDVSAPPFIKVKNGPILLGSFTPLLFAVTYGPHEAVKILLDAGADIQAREGRGMTALHLAVSSESRDPRTIKLLVERGVDVSAKMVTGETAADWAAQGGLDDAVRALGQKPRMIPAATPARPTAVPDVAIRAAATRAVNLLQKTSASFFVEGGCAACHAHDMTALAAGLARKNGIPVNEKLLTDQTLQVRSQWKPMADALLDRLDTPGGSDMNNFALLGLAAVGEKADRYTDAMIRNTANVQMPDGRWFGGGFSRTPVADSVITSTALGIRSLQLFGPEGCRTEFTARIAKAREWLIKAPAVYADDRAWRLLGLKWSGAPEAVVRSATEAVTSHQNKDGGWSQNAALESDAYATGQALYALAMSGVPRSDTAFAAGVSWLVRTQASDGSWHVKRRAVPFQPYFESGFPYGHDQWISEFGTAWSAAALSLALSPGHEGKPLAVLLPQPRPER